MAFAPHCKSGPGFTSSTFNKPPNIGRVHKLLNKWERCSDDEFREGQAMLDNGRVLVTDRAKAQTFASKPVSHGKSPSEAGSRRQA